MRNDNMDFVKLKNFFLQIFPSKFTKSVILPPLIGLIFLVILLSTISPHFLTVRNILSVLRQISIISLVAIGMSHVIITNGSIDLSVGSVAALGGVVTGHFLGVVGLNLYFSMILGVLSGAICGFITGFLVASKVKMPPFIASLSMMSVARGFALIITDGRPIFNLPQTFRFIGADSFLGLPILVIIMLIMYLISYINLTYGKTGLYFYAVGGDTEAARVAGINTNRVIMYSFIISGVCAAMAGILLASRVMVSDPIAGFGYELDAIASSIIGGVSIFGGRGIILGTLIGAIIIGVLRNGLNLLNVSAFIQQVVIGVVIATMVSINIIRGGNR